MTDEYSKDEYEWAEDLMIMIVMIMIIALTRKCASRIIFGKIKYFW